MATGLAVPFAGRHPRAFDAPIRRRNLPRSSCDTHQSSAADRASCRLAPGTARAAVPISPTPSRTSARFLFDPLWGARFRERRLRGVEVRGLAHRSSAASDREAAHCRSEPARPRARHRRDRPQRERSRRKGHAGVKQREPSAAGSTEPQPAARSLPVRIFGVSDMRVVRWIGRVVRSDRDGLDPFCHWRNFAARCQRPFIYGICSTMGDQSRVMRSHRHPARRG